MNVKQVIVVRKDLKMSKGRCASQVAHASMAALLQPDVFSSSTPYEMEVVVSPHSNMEETILITRGVDYFTEYWLNNKFTKICLAVNSESELLALSERVKERRIRNYLIKDNGDTVFNGVPTYTCLAIGPYRSSEIDELTGDLKLL